jgi:hypothetical protein
MIPDYWTSFVEEHGLTDKDIEIPEDGDLSEIGAEFRIMKPEDTIEEANDFYPGLVVKNDGYIPIGSCSTGSGDPYFINANDGPKGPLYRIYHDSVHDEGYDKKEAVALVLKNYEGILGHIGS